MYKKIKNRNDLEWIDYNLYMLSVKNLSVKSVAKSSHISLIIFDLLISIIYVFISNRIKSKKLFSRK